MPDISTLIPDIYKIVTNKGGWFSEEIAKELGHDISTRLQTQFNERKASPTLRLSQMGPRCPKALWHSIHTPEQAEAFPPFVEIKLGYGHVIEALAIALAKASGHSVEGEQDELYLDGIRGHRDCVIDGCLVDVKSTTSIGFSKFKDGSLAHNDSFGYLEQLDAYIGASSGDPLVRCKDRGFILAIDKNLGHMCLYEHRLRIDHIKQRIVQHKEIVGRSSPPDCCCKSIPDGASGNLKLDTRASYSPYKFSCFPHLRTFIYAGGKPVFLTKVVKKPSVLEVDRFGKYVYN